MTTKAQVKTQAKTPAASTAARIPQHPVAVPEHEAERPDIADQLEGAARLGHCMRAVGVDRPAPPVIQRQEMQQDEEEELQLTREPAAVQRQEVPEEEEEELQKTPAPPGEVALQRQALPEEEEELMMKPEEGRVGRQGGQVPPVVEAAINRARGGGQPLEGALQEQMGASLGHDFSGVRVHTDAEADKLNQQLQAKAFTTGPDIFFKRGAYSPAPSSGQELIAHELTHVVQQSKGKVGGEGSGMTVRPAGDVFEQEAEGKARRTSGGSATLPRGPKPRRRALSKSPGATAIQRAGPHFKALLHFWRRKEVAGAEAKAAQRAAPRGPVLGPRLQQLPFARLMREATQVDEVKRIVEENPLPAPEQIGVSVRPDDTVAAIEKAKQGDKAKEQDVKDLTEGAEEKSGAEGENKWKVGPGIYVKEGSSDGFLGFIKEQFKLIGQNKVGNELLSKFEIANQEHTVKHSSEGRVIIRESSADPRLGVEQPSHVPGQIIIPNPASQLGKKLKGGKGTVEQAGITGHPDYPGNMASWDVILHHELVHAYLKKTGVADRLEQTFEEAEVNYPPWYQQFSKAAKVGRPYATAVEELLVTGIIEAHALPFSENAYLKASNKAPRKSYREYGIRVEHEIGYDSSGDTDSSIVNQLKHIDIPENIALRIAKGTS
jgi:hypothetical protein